MLTGKGIDHIELSATKAFDWMIEMTSCILLETDGSIETDGSVLYKNLPFKFKNQILSLDLYVKQKNKTITVVFSDGSEEVEYQ